MTSACTCGAMPQGSVGFEVLVGGGLGRTPIIGKVIREFLPREHLLSYLEAILRIYNLEGRRDNIYKARIKILVKAMGTEAFRDAGRGRVGADPRVRRCTLDAAEIDRVRAFFAPPPYETLPDVDVDAGPVGRSSWPGIATTRARTRCPAIAPSSCR